jgi:hypothetical protein
MLPSALFQCDVSQDLTAVRGDNQMRVRLRDLWRDYKYLPCNQGGRINNMKNVLNALPPVLRNIYTF